MNERAKKEAMKNELLKGESKRNVFLYKIKVLQIVSNEQRKKQGLSKIGKGYFRAYRYNPLNPISYLIFILAIVYAIIVSIIEVLKTGLENPFKWN